MHPLLFDLGTFQLGPLEVPLRLPSYGAAMLAGVLLGWFIVSLVSALASWYIGPEGRYQVLIVDRRRLR